MLTVNAAEEDPAEAIRRETGGGAQGMLVTAVRPTAFGQAVGMVGRGGTMSLVGLPPGNFPLDIFGMVLNGITVRGSIVGTRLDLQESLDFAERRKVKATVSTANLEDINDIFARMHKGDIEGRIVLDLASGQKTERHHTCGNLGGLPRRQAPKLGSGHRPCGYPEVLRQILASAPPRNDMRPSMAQLLSATQTHLARSFGWPLWDVRSVRSRNSERLLSA